ncbi:MAG: hypothetical protein K0S07_641 [Chlamydiales bacterium]|jgi:hypothetical protein|nr:hypothetical protein [Chlamydiales bacterium]
MDSPSIRPRFSSHFSSEASEGPHDVKDVYVEGIPFVSNKKSAKFADQVERMKKEEELCSLFLSIQSSPLRLPTQLSEVPSMMKRAAFYLKLPLPNRLQVLKNQGQLASFSAVQLHAMLNLLVFEQKLMRLNQKIVHFFALERQILDNAERAGKKITSDPSLNITHVNRLEAFEAHPLSELLSSEKFPLFSLEGVADIPFLLHFFHLQDLGNGQETLLANDDLTWDEWMSMLSLRNHVSLKIQDLAENFILWRQSHDLNAQLKVFNHKRILLVQQLRSFFCYYQKDASLIRLLESTVPSAAALIGILHLFALQEAEEEGVSEIKERRLSLEAQLVELFEAHMQEQSHLYRYLYEELAKMIRLLQEAKGALPFDCLSQAKWLFRAPGEEVPLKRMPLPHLFNRSVQRLKEEAPEPLAIRSFQVPRTQAPKKKKSRRRPHRSGEKAKEEAKLPAPSLPMQVKKSPLSKEWLKRSSPFTYAARVARWFKVSPGQPLPPEQFSGYEERTRNSQERSRIRHAFSRLVDQVIYLSSHIYESKEKGAALAFHALAQFDYYGEIQGVKKERGVITWAYTAKKAKRYCHHRFFSNLENFVHLALAGKKGELFALHRARSLEEGEKEEDEALEPLAHEAYQYDPLLNLHKFNDRINQVVITIFPSFRHLAS